MSEKVIRVIFVLSFLICTTPRWILAQGTLNALDVSPGTTVVGNRSSGGVGWAFVPTTDLLVTGISSTAPQVDFWLGTNQNIASYYYGGPYYSGGGHIFDSGYPTNFQSISNLLLSAGQTYFISTQNTNSLGISFFAYSLNGTNGLAAFNIST